MARRIVHLALFKEEQLDEAAEAIQKLHDLGVSDDDISVISGTPFCMSTRSETLRTCQLSVTAPPGGTVFWSAVSRTRGNTGSTSSSVVRVARNRPGLSQARELSAVRV